MAATGKVVVIFIIATLVTSSGASIVHSSHMTVQHVNKYADADWPPKFCNHLDCPKYTVVNTTKEYEIRNYDASRWVSTSEMNIAYDQATHDMFMRLFDYISGKNVQGEKINMTAPVINRVVPGLGPACENNFTLSFYISNSVTTPPIPTDKLVYLSKLSKMTVYVRSFGGFAGQAEYIKNARALADALPTSAKYIHDYFYTTGYDAPFKLFHRHNEVWFIGN